MKTSHVHPGEFNSRIETTSTAPAAPRMKVTVRGTIAFVSAVLLLAAGFGVGGCKDSTTAPGNDIVFPDSAVSYAAHVQPLFTLRCANSACHDDQSRAGDLSLTSYIAMTSRPGIVVPGNSAGSLLMQKIDGRLPHSPGIPIIINDNQKKGIKKWIDEGARNN